MPRPILSLLMAVGIAAGCAGDGPEPPRMVYLPPTGQSAKASSVRVPQTSNVVWAQLLEELRRSPSTIEQADRTRGLVVATYVGGPEEHVDCGWIVEDTPEGLIRTSGSSQRMVFRSDDESATTRTMRLNARTTFQVRPAGLDTLIDVESVYVLTRIVEIGEDSGRTEERYYEVVSFPSGGKGRFESGTVCQPTASLERLALEGLPTSVVTAAASGPTRSIADLRDRLDCAGADSSYCEVLDITAPYRQANAQGLGLKLEAYGSGRGVLHEADLLTLDISFPSYPSYLHVAYIERSGRVGQVTPGNTQLWPARAAHYVQETSYEIAEPFGTEMILAVATERPLFATTRPQYEPVQNYLDALRRSLAQLQAENPEALIAVDAIFVQTEPRPTSAPASYLRPSES